MRGHLWRKILSYGFFALGALFLLLGARDFIESRIGQAAGERDFDFPVVPGNVAGDSRFPTGVRTGDIVAKLVIPRLQAELFVVEGVGKKELRRGPGHVPGTALPGVDNNCVIAGHRDTHFRVLKDVREGDDILLETSSGKFLYRVKSTRVVAPENNTAMRDTSGPELNLITCFPFYYVGPAPKRFVVQAGLAGATIARSAAAKDFSSRP